LPKLTHGRSRAYFFDFDGDGPAAPGSVVAHRAVLRGQGLLVVSGDTRIETGADLRFRAMAKNPA